MKKRFALYNERWRANVMELSWENKNSIRMIKTKLASIRLCLYIFGMFIHILKELLYSQLIKTMIFHWAFLEAGVLLNRNYSERKISSRVLIIQLFHSKYCIANTHPFKLSRKSSAELIGLKCANYFEIYLVMLAEFELESIPDSLSIDLCNSMFIVYWMEEPQLMLSWKSISPVNL